MSRENRENREYIGELLDMADIPPKYILGIIWHLGWFGMVQNTPTGCGNDLPIILRTSKNHEKYNYYPPSRKSPIDLRSIDAKEPQY